MAEGLTGLEQYSFERAGYFVRRGAIDTVILERVRSAAARMDLADSAAERELGEACAAIGALPLLHELAADVLGEAALTEATFSAAPDEPSEWFRSFPLDHSLLAGEQWKVIQAHQHILHILAPLSDGLALRVLAGSQEEHLHPADARAIAADPLVCLPGSTPVRLSPGDVLIYSAGLLRRREPEAGHVGAVDLAFARPR